jgi:hypothetical protein
MRGERRERECVCWAAGLGAEGEEREVADYRGRGGGEGVGVEDGVVGLEEGDVSWGLRFGGGFEGEGFGERRQEKMGCRNRTKKAYRHRGAVLLCRVSKT